MGQRGKKGLLTLNEDIIVNYGLKLGAAEDLLTDYSHTDCRE
jgi:hypothetical protein